jgi:uncharacterized membrane protein
MTYGALRLPRTSDHYFEEVSISGQCDWGIAKGAAIMAYQQPPQPQATSGASHGMSTLISGLGSDFMAGISYLLGIFWVLGFILQIVVFAVEKNRYVKFHAAQAALLGVVEVVLGVVYFILNAVLFSAASLDQSGTAGLGATAVSGIVGCVIGLLGLATFAFWIWGMIAAFTGKATKLPVIGSFAEGLAGGPVQNEGL